MISIKVMKSMIFNCDNDKEYVKNKYLLFVIYNVDYRNSFFFFRLVKPTKCIRPQIFSIYNACVFISIKRIFYVL